MSLHPRKPLIVAVTGGIASGKTSVTDQLATKGPTVIDADLISRELVEPGQPALLEIVEHFGIELLDASGRLDRAALRRAIFSDPAQRQRLEAILHPRVRAALRQRAEVASGPYAILAIPLLTETSAYAWVDRVVVVDAPVTMQIERLMRRDGSDREQALAILAAQATREQRLAIANDVVVNDGDLPQLKFRTDRLHRHLLHLSERPEARPA